MNKNSKPFFSAFPNLIMDEKYRELLRYVTVERVTVNSVRNRLRVYISSDNWLKKSTVFEMEKAIREQVFPETEMEVKSSSASICPYPIRRPISTRFTGAVCCGN